MFKELEMLCRSHGPVNQFNPNQSINNSYNYAQAQQQHHHHQQQQQQQHQNLEQSAQINSTTSPNNINTNLMLNDISCGGGVKNPNTYSMNKVYSNSSNLSNTSGGNNVSQIIGETISNSMNSIDTSDIFKENLISTKFFNECESDLKVGDTPMASAFGAMSSNHYNNQKTIKECLNSLNGGANNVDSMVSNGKKSKYIRKRDLLGANVTLNAPVKRAKKEPKPEKETKTLKEEPVSPKANNENETQHGQNKIQNEERPPPPVESSTPKNDPTTETN